MNKVTLFSLSLNIYFSFNYLANFFFNVIPLKITWFAFPNRPILNSILDNYTCAAWWFDKNYHQNNLLTKSIRNKLWIQIIIYECILIYKVLFIFLLVSKKFFINGRALSTFYFNINSVTRDIYFIFRFKRWWWSRWGSLCKVSSKNKLVYVNNIFTKDL